MKNSILFLLIVLIVSSCKSKKEIAETVKEDKTTIVVAAKDVDNHKIDRAYDLGKRLLETCNTSKFVPFTNKEATPKVIANATVEKISATCKKINLRNGKFIDLKLVDITHNKLADEYIFRYAIDYEKKLNKRELFVTINADNKITAIKTQEVKPKPF